MSKTFDPMTDVPQTDDEVKIALSYSRDDSISRNLFGIYQCRRAQGATVHEAYEVALKAHLEAAGYEIEP